ncbi:hypothetical protein LOTGIDRAFT_232702 [Lottia gigantea]|uniref:WD repeat and coiled-coil-containing protein n=1 Tax=Lottia gigantea TaxID=225164 RepID=V4A913_LOTGI|nr:hypothetical protein LOTGIDRAFT_232702 [Lottia gigantea]ESO93252.1 hypothetical protein LOTGIDRAFT_232702 [Lottia gigantea]
MNLGESILKRSGVNGLAHAIHPRHGLVWSDGKAIFLSPLNIFNNQLHNSSSTRLGEFDNVENVCWSNDVNETTCFMCVIHNNYVTVWKVTGLSPKLSFKQVRKINVKPIPQGVLWNPKCDVLCLFSRNQVSFYFNHLKQKGSYAFPPLVSGKINCGCWSRDGNKLLVCVGSSLLIYTWSNIETSLSDFMPSAWTLPKSDGNVTAIVPVNDSKYICCVDLPLERLCHNQDLYLIPELPESDNNNKYEKDVLKSGNSISIKDQLFNLPKNPQSSGCIIVGCNNLPQLQIYTVSESTLTFTTQIQLQKNERPKGISSVSGNVTNVVNGVLILIGELEKKENIFPSSGTDCDYKLSVQYYPVTPDRSLQHCHSHSEIDKVKICRPSSKIKSVSESALKQIQVSENTEPVSLVIPQPVTITPSSKSLISNIDDTIPSNTQLELEKTGFKDSVPKFHSELDNVRSTDSHFTRKKSQIVKGNKSKLLYDESQVSASGLTHKKLDQLEDSLSDPGLSISSCNSGNYEVLESLVETQKDQIEELQKKVQSLSMLVDESSVINITKYQTPEDPDHVKVVCVYDNGSTRSRKFLLDNGRLQLDTLKRAFKLDYIELIIDDDPMVLSSNIDGYIPIKFIPGSTLNITGDATADIIASIKHSTIASRA